MWEHLFNNKVLQKIIDEYMYEDETEDLETMRKAIEHISAHVEYKDAIRIALGWKDLTESVKVAISVGLVEEEESSRFILVMDYLSDGLEVDGKLL